MSQEHGEPTVESRMAFQGRLINVRVDTVKLPQGKLTTREIVEHAPCVCIVPVDEQDRVVLVRQYRKPAEKEMLEIPAGSIEPGEDPEKAALRELEEETGYTATRLRHLCSFWMTPGYCTEEMHAYLAQGLKPGSLRPDEDEDIEVVKVPLDDLPEMIARGEFQDAKSIASLLTALRLLGRR